MNLISHLIPFVIAGFVVPLFYILIWYLREIRIIDDIPAELPLIGLFFTYLCMTMFLLCPSVIFMGVFLNIIKFRPSKKLSIREKIIIYLIGISLNILLYTFIGLLYWVIFKTIKNN
jgi:hypothetical protein